MKKYKVNTEYEDKNTGQLVEVGTTVELSDDRYKEIISVIGKDGLTEIKSKTKKEDKE